MRLLKILFTTIIVVSMIGCGSSDIDIVKNEKFLIDESYTNMQALDKREICDEVEWESYEDKRERTIVEYKCILHGSEAYFDNKLSGLINIVEDNYKSNIASYDTKIENLNNQNLQLEKRVKFNKKLSKEFFETNNTDLLYSNRLIKYGVRNNKGIKIDDQHLFNIDDLGMFNTVKNIWMWQKIINNSIKKKNEKDAKRYQKLVDRDLPKLNKYIKDKIQKESNSLTDGIKIVKKLKKSRDNKISILQNERDKKIEDINKLDVKYAYEKIQWSITDKKNSSIQYIGIVYVSQDKEDEEAFNNIKGALSIAINDAVTDYAKYISYFH